MGDLTCPAPWLGPHYRAFIATTSWSASVLRIGTLPHVALAARGSPSRRPGCRQHPMQPVVRIEATDSPVPCQGLQRAHATFTPDTARATSRQLPGSGHAINAHPFPRTETQPRFRCQGCFSRCVSSGLHMFVFSLLTRPAGSGPSPQSLPTPALDRHDTAMVWDLRLHGEPGGPPSIPGTARFVLRSSTSSPLPFQDAQPPIVSGAPGDSA